MTRSTVTLKEGDTLYVYVGQAGSYGTTSTYTATSGAGINGGGAAGYRGGTGGDASDIRLDVNKDGSGTLYERIIVAGGGGGAYAYSTTYKAAGGVGGGTSGTAGSYYSSTYSAWVGGGASQTAGGSAGTGSSTNYYGKAGTFGAGGASGYKSSSTSYYSNGAGGGGWYGGGSAGNYSSSSRTRAAGGGGGSGFVLTSSTKSNTPSGYLITDTSYYLEDAATIAGSSSFISPTGSNETGHSGNGYARISYISTVPTLEGLTDLTIAPGTNYDLLSDVTCVDNGDGCTLVKVSITDTSTLAEGEYEVTYIVKDSNNVKYKYTRTLLILTNLDTSGANSPDLIQGLVPITYSNNKWIKADSSNLDVNYKWYDYNNKQWANAVLVSSTYRNSDGTDKFTIGQEVPESAILAYYVWIPRYKYKVWNINKVIGTDSYDAYNTGIDIIFENEKESTGEIKCTEYSYTKISSTSTISETCTGSNGEYYTHPAFTFGDAELRGIWVGKFESSSSSPTSAKGGGTSTSLTIRIKPNVNPWANNPIDNCSLVVQNMQTNNNVYGLTTDKTKADTHLIKNMEWGSIAYLTNSKYGLCTNDSCSEIKINSYVDMSSGVIESYTYKTGCGPQSSDSISYGEVCYSYNTEIGQLASTTGNIYGIYDMSGGLDEFVMANMTSTNGTYTYYQGSAGTNFTYSADTAKYIDTYADCYDSATQKAFNRSRLGDAMGEVVITESDSGSWYSDYSKMFNSGWSYPWLRRGGFLTSEGQAGIFSFYVSKGEAADQLVRAILVSLE